MWLCGLVLGVIAALVGMFIVAPIKGNPIAGGWVPANMLRSFVINGCWGFGVGLILPMLMPRSLVRVHHLMGIAQRTLASPDYLSHRPIGCGGCARITSSFTSTPQPGPVGNTSSPFSITGTGVTRSSFQGTSSMSISITRKFGIAAHICALISEPMWPLKLCGATFTS